jgi:predicted  nucleic acid-binding Zn-ribbon protein
MVNTEFRSPLRKLVAFFKTSRDKWKAKCQRAKYELKLIKRRFEHLQKNRDLWQQRYQRAEMQCEQLQAQREHLHDRNLELQARVEAIPPKKTR